MDQLARTRAADETRTWPQSFHDRLTAPLPGWRDFLRVAVQGGPRPSKEALADVPNLPVRRSGLPTVTSAQTAVTWVGHASYVVQIGGLVVLTDPVWSRRIPGVRPRLTPPGIDWHELPPIDAIVISHNHYDHLDGPTLKRLPRDTPVFVPAGLGRWFRKRGFRRINELDWWESAQLGEVTFDFVPAHHWSRRTLTDMCRSLWGGWVLTAADQRVYFAGDTGYGHFFTDIGNRYPGIDLALLPVGAFEPRWMMRDWHTNPEEAVQACLDLGATRMATMHWGTFVLSAEPVLSPVEKARQAWAETGRPRADLWDLAVGESRVIATADALRGDPAEQSGG
jgi:L-ascorbate metabolism protein UlaG (beta-lactamase superfamily)